NNMGYVIPPPAIVILVMMAAGLCVICGFVIHRLVGSSDSPQERHRSREQDIYMRQVRTRN
ncbi:hypothetical protein K432DRAFT_279347, partial [Lepidopterella palustris CBS 459.81]